jgi:CRISPR-associated protein Csb1
MDFDAAVARATGGYVPYAYQRRMAERGLPDLLQVPTGAGKTLAAVLPWLYRRIMHGDAVVREATPRWLVVVLPQRGLVEQTAGVVGEWLHNLGMPVPVEFLTSSRLEAHRLASPFVHTATLDGRPMFEVIRERLGLAADTPLNRRSMAAAVAALDPFCLLHGVFFARKEWLGQPKFERAVSAVIEAHHVRRAVSGGRKSDRVRHQLDLGVEGGGTAEGYGSVPFHRTEWTAKRIVASFVVDVELLRSYGLPVPATELLETLALWEIRTLLDGALRLRTACDLEVAGEITPRWSGFELPKRDHLTERLAGLLAASGDVFGDGTPLTVQWSGKPGKPAKPSKKV